MRLPIGLLLFLAALHAAPADDLSKRLDTLEREVRPQEAMAWVRQVYATDRWFTFPKFDETAEFLRRTLESIGLERVEIVRPPADGKTQFGFWTMPMAWDARSATLELLNGNAPPVLLADYRKIPTSLGMWSGSTKPEGVVADVVEIQSLQDLARADVKGKLVLTARNPAEWKFDLVKAGALGAINAFTENPELLDGRQWINAWGDRGWAFNKGDTPLLCFSISPRQAAIVRARLKQGRVQVRAKVDARHYEGSYPYVTGVIPGASGAEEVLTLGHTSEQGAQDNATGVSTMLESLATLNRLIKTGKLARPQRSIRVLLMGEMYAALHYIATNPDRVKRTIAAMCVDTPASPYELKGTEYSFYMNPHSGTAYTDGLIKEIARVYFPRVKRPWYWKPFMPGTDSYLGEPSVGIPTTWAYSGTGVETHHNSEDTPDRVDTRSLRDLIIVNAAFLYTMASAGEAEAAWLADLMAKHWAEGAASDYRRERSNQAVLSVLRLVPEARRDAVRESLRPLLQSTQAPPAGSGIVVRRKRFGTIPLDDLAPDQREGFPSGAWTLPPSIALYWCDGRRPLSEVVRLTEGEIGAAKFDYKGYFRFLARRGYVDLVSGPAAAARPFLDRTHHSKVFGAERNYRIFLPPGYDANSDRYPVIYYFHGHSDRYTLERYDNGTDTVPKIAAWVASHPAIVVAVDGYVARDYTGFYGGSPWDVRIDGGDFDFGAYFHELAAHVDSSYRTLTSRRYRATSGLSMGGFMSLWLSARYPDLIGSASSFNPGPEFYVGPKGRRFLWRPKDQVPNLRGTMVRLIRASGDYISQYHEETRDAFARDAAVDFEFRQDEYHRHWATSIAETFDFHARAFAAPNLDNTHETWSHTEAYDNADVHGWRIEGRGLKYLEDVSQTGLRIRTRRWAPDGPPDAETAITLRTPPLYSPGAEYRLLDLNLLTGETARKSVTADSHGRLTIATNGAGHQWSISGPGAGAQPPVLLPVTTSDRLRLPAGADMAFPVRVYNPRAEAMTDVTVKVASDYPTVRVLQGEARIERLESGAIAGLTNSLRVRLTAGAGYLEHARLRISLTFDGWHQSHHDVDISVIPENVPRPAALEILDGRTVTLDVFRQKGNQGGGGSVRRTVTEGKGNGNGILEPGEEATFWVKLAQGIDAFDKNNWYRAKVYSQDPWIEEAADIQEQKQLEWTGAQERTSLVRMRAKPPAGASTSLLLDHESWTFHFTPDVRYGAQPLYQAFQRHRRHLYRYEWTLP
ncbi:MAG: alpha/beta hydrolase-fold protein [Bryobacteraceae bacterium]